MERDLVQLIPEIIRSPTIWFSWIAVSIIIITSVIGVIWITEQSESLNKVFKSNLRVLSVTLGLTLLIAEMFLRVSGITVNSIESRVGHYRFLNHGSFRDSLHVWPPSEDHVLGDPAIFQFARHSNSIGLSDQEWAREKPDSTLRILSLGDSFTEGDGAPADSSWPKVLMCSLLKQNIPVEVMNAGVCGSDPFYELMLYELKLKSFTPDIILMAVSTQDFIEDIAVRGGMERFDPNSGRFPKMIEVLYAYSHFARLVMNNALGYTWQLIKPNKELVEKMADNTIPRMFDEIKRIENTSRSEVIVLLYPHQHELYVDSLIGRGASDEDLARNLIETVLKETSQRHGVRLVDLRPCYQDYVASKQNNYRSYWWQRDGHHNSKGYEMMAHCIERVLLQVMTAQKHTGSE